MRFLVVALFLSGCASPPLYTGFRSLASVKHACEWKETPSSLCANYRATESLRKDHHVVRAEQFCERFYTVALQSADLLCAYIKDQEGIMNDGDGKDSANVSARGKQLHYRYTARAKKLREELEHSFRNEGAGGTQKALEELKAEGVAHLRQEIECDEKGAPLVAPGLLVSGLVKQSLNDQQKTLQNLLKYLSNFQEELLLQEERQMTKIHSIIGSSLAGMEKQEVPKLVVSDHSLNAAALAAVGRREFEAGEALDIYERHTASRGDLTSEKVADQFQSTKNSMGYCRPAL